MPQGNDTAYHEAFRSSVEGQYGTYPNAEDLIRHHAASVDPGVRRAGLTQIDPKATDALREDGVDKVEKQFKGLPKGWTLEDFAVRGNAIVGVFLDEQGVYHKRVAPANDRWKAPEDTAAFQQEQVEARVRDETARLRAEADARIAEVQAEENERISKELAKIREKADKDIAKATEKADEKPAEKSGSQQQASENRSGGAGASASRAAGGKAATDDAGKE